MKRVESLTDTLRWRLREVTGGCEACGAAGMTVREIAKLSGVHQHAVWRFQKGKPITSTNLDKLYAWVVRRALRTPAKEGA